ncbi:Metallo-dependent phosphatase-like protein [Paraphoma chrysanthemicola]|uniref:Metallo-dependent phosphatase-like protein n=1 Tax=Paraphoma chrysanthemicola TaxID=798071 RepID=A0A8K0QU27_9PLEO|nr:Metallo-dependent phosphatase-like protein [Paraphoma chrysanthemicola]
MPHTSHPYSVPNPPAKPNLFTPTPPSIFESFLTNPILFLARYIYTHQAPIAPPPSTSPCIRLVCISDTHNSRRRVAQGDVLIHAGDLSVNGSVEEVQRQAVWLGGLMRRDGREGGGFEHVVVVAGNHDTCLDVTYPSKSHPRTQQRAGVNWHNITYLQTQSTTLTLRLPNQTRTRTLRIHASPLTPQYGNWAFQYPHDRNVWHNTIPVKTDILITHGPPRGHLDFTGTYHAGCAHLLRETWRVKPRVHVCGHIHCARGVEVLDWGWVQWGYDGVVAGVTKWRWGWRVCVLALMSLVWMWEWSSWVILGRKRKGLGWIVNAAIVGDGREEGVVVEI